MDRMRQKIAALGIVFILGAGAGVVAHQQRLVVPENFFDFDVPASPCGAVTTLQASPFVYRDTVWLTYLCGDNRVVMRQLAQVAPLPAPVPTDPEGTRCATFGLVPSRYVGGCVPANHPDAK
jgi:hypothetical protein